MRLRSWLPTALVASALLFAVSPAPAGVVERIVAVVGEQPILLSELYQRGKPVLVRIYDQAKVQGWKDTDVKQATGEMQKELLNKLVDERLVSMSADKLNVTVTTKEVDEALKLKAADMKAQVSDLIADAAKDGYSEADFREEVRRELLFHKMLETRVLQRVRVTEEDIKEYYRRILVTERKQQQYRASVIKLDLPIGGDGEAWRAFADDLVKSARSGYDFAILARKYSTDGSRVNGGDLGQMNPGTLGKVLDETVLRLGVGEVS